MFAGGSPGVRELEQAPPGELARYCTYEWTTPGQAPSSAALVRAVQTSPGLDADSAGFDCALASAQGQSEARENEAINAAMHEVFRRNIGWVSGAILATSSSAREAVEIALVDSAPRRRPGQGAPQARHPHARLLRALINEISCPDDDPNCAVKLHSLLALPRIDAETAPDWVHGGDQGTPADVALGVYEAVARWRARADSPHLIINLSLGWEQAASPRAPDLALETALEYASCQGALVFAAAGNSRDFGCDAGSGPLTPASLEQRPAPDAARCAALGLVPTKPTGRSSALHEGPRPLVVAVGALDERGRPLATSRAGSQARLAASASNALAQSETGGYTMALSGSSVAAAVASASAALIWSYRPTLAADELVELLTHSGWDSGIAADFGFADPDTDTAPTVHRLSVCAALEAACTHPGEACPTLECPSVDPASDGHRGLVREAMTARRERAPTSVKVFRNHAAPVRTTCEDRGPELATAL